MIVEEEMANKKICPYEQGSRQAYNCQGSKCMAWRWIDEHTAIDYSLPCENGLHSTTHGYCGLAGRP